MSFRRATEADLPTLLEMQRDFYARDMAFDPASALRSMRQLATDDSLGRLFVIEHENAIVGYFAIAFGFSLEFRGRDAFLDELYVAPQARGRGLGTAALRAVEEACLEAGVKALHLEVHHENHGAKALYRRSGFYDHDRHLMTKHLGARVIETERLRLRPATEADVDVLHCIWTDPDVRRYLWDDRVIEREVAAKVVAANEADWRDRGYGLWVVEESNEPIGFVGFRSDEDPRPELLFGFLPTHWHRGLAAEAARAAIDYAFHVLHSDAIWAATDPPNEASVRLMERLGMQFERRGTLNGLDTVFYALRR